MPYIIRKRWGKWEVRKKWGGKLIGKHDTLQKAKAQIAAIEMHEHETGSENE